jgi:hypothetical protein
MKTSPTVSFRRPASSVLGLLSVLLVSVTALRLAADTAPAAAEPKTHTLFMGADFSIEQGGQLYRVQDVDGGSFVIKVDGKEVRVPMARGLSKFRIEPALKLAETSANVTNLKGEPTYTLANDPTVNFQRGLAQAQLQYADASYAQNLASDVQQNVSSKVINTVGLDPISAGYSAAAQAGAKAQLLTTATNNVNKADAAPGTSFREKGNPLGAEGNFDAMEVAFEVSSEKPLNRPYVVITVEYRAPGDKPGQVGNWVYARTLNPIGRGAAKVHVTQGGFPAGFELQDFQVHLYNEGQEIASNVAPKRVALTREEAFQYVVVDYIGSHKGATLPATPAMGQLPADLPARLARQEFQQTYYVKVAKDGRGSEMYADEACSRKIEDPYLIALVKNIRFKPALDKGRPVDAVAAFKLNQLPI